MKITIENLKKNPVTLSYKDELDFLNGFVEVSELPEVLQANEDGEYSKHAKRKLRSMSRNVYSYTASIAAQMLQDLHSEKMPSPYWTRYSSTLEKEFDLVYSYLDRPLQELKTKNLIRSQQRAIRKAIRLLEVNSCFLDEDEVESILKELRFRLNNSLFNQIQNSINSLSDYRMMKMVRMKFRKALCGQLHINYKPSYRGQMLNGLKTLDIWLTKQGFDCDYSSQLVGWELEGRDDDSWRAIARYCKANGLLPMAMPGSKALIKICDKDGNPSNIMGLFNAAFDEVSEKAYFLSGHTAPALRSTAGVDLEPHTNVKDIGWVCIYQQASIELPCGIKLKGPDGWGFQSFNEGDSCQQRTWFGQVLEACKNQKHATVGFAKGLQSFGKMCRYKGRLVSRTTMLKEEGYDGSYETFCEEHPDHESAKGVLGLEIGQCKGAIKERMKQLVGGDGDIKALLKEGGGVVWLDGHDCLSWSIIDTPEDSFTSLNFQPMANLLGELSNQLTPSNVMKVLNETSNPEKLEELIDKLNIEGLNKVPRTFFTSKVNEKMWDLFQNGPISRMATKRCVMWDFGDKDFSGVSLISEDQLPDRFKDRGWATCATWRGPFLVAQAAQANLAVCPKALKQLLESENIQEEDLFKKIHERIKKKSRQRNFSNDNVAQEATVETIRGLVELNEIFPVDKKLVYISVQDAEDMQADDDGDAIAVDFTKSLVDLFKTTEDHWLEFFSDTGLKPANIEFAKSFQIKYRDTWEDDDKRSYLGDKVRIDGIGFDGEERTPSIMGYSATQLTEYWSNLTDSPDFWKSCKRSGSNPQGPVGAGSDETAEIALHLDFPVKDDTYVLTEKFNELWRAYNAGALVTQVSIDFQKRALLLLLALLGYLVKNVDGEWVINFENQLGEDLMDFTVQRLGVNEVTFVLTDDGAIFRMPSQFSEKGYTAPNAMDPQEFDHAYEKKKKYTLPLIDEDNGCFHADLVLMFSRFVLGSSQEEHKYWKPKNKALLLDPSWLEGCLKLCNKKWSGQKTFVCNMKAYCNSMLDPTIQEHISNEKVLDNVEAEDEFLQYVAKNYHHCYRNIADLLGSKTSDTGVLNPVLKVKAILTGLNFEIGVDEFLSSDEFFPVLKAFIQHERSEEKENNMTQALWQMLVEGYLKQTDVEEETWFNQPKRLFYEKRHSLIETFSSFKVSGDNFMSLKDDYPVIFKNVEEAYRVARSSYPKGTDWKYLLWVELIKSWKRDWLEKLWDNFEEDIHTESACKVIWNEWTALQRAMLVMAKGQERPLITTYISFPEELEGEPQLNSRVNAKYIKEEGWKTDSVIRLFNSDNLGYAKTVARLLDGRYIEPYLPSKEIERGLRAFAEEPCFISSYEAFTHERPYSSNEMKTFLAFFNHGCYIGKDGKAYQFADTADFVSVRNLNWNLGTLVDQDKMKFYNFPLSSSISGTRLTLSLKDGDDYFYPFLSEDSGTIRRPNDCHFSYTWSEISNHYKYMILKAFAFYYVFENGKLLGSEKGDRSLNYLRPVGRREVKESAIAIMSEFERLCCEYEFPVPDMEFKRNLGLNSETGLSRDEIEQIQFFSCMFDRKTSGILDKCLIYTGLEYFEEDLGPEFKQRNGSIFHSQCDAITNPVNCVGTMGAGLAKQFHQRYDGLLNAYKSDCSDNILRIGNPTWYSIGKSKFVCCFPTKDHFENPSKLEYIEQGLLTLKKQVAEIGVKSIALPLLGCGLGGLREIDVVKLITTILGDSTLETVEICRLSKKA